MSKKILAGIIAGVISLSLIGCGKEANEDVTKSKSISEDQKKYKDLVDGEWSENINAETLQDKFNDLFSKVENKTKEYGLEYSKEQDKITEDNDGEAVKETYIYLDQENPEVNRLESLYIGLKLYGTSEDRGQIIMKTSLNIDGSEILKTGEIKFQDTSLASYAEIFTGISNRDYSDINKKIVEVLKSDSGEGVITDSVNGLYEEFTITKDYIVYTLETKEYDLKQAEENMN